MRPACERDAEGVLQILEEGRASIERLGIKQWGHGYPGIEDVLADIALRACFVAQDDSGHLLGTLAIRLDRDADYTASKICWLTCDAGDGEPPYAAIHRCASAHAALRRGVMDFMFRAAEKVCRDAGRRSIRIDTHPGNTAMRGFLRHRGFSELSSFSLVSHGASADRVRIGYEKLLER
ncbi:GCN5-related N-acetyltransferase [Coriobacterium glomerans PW2]|uniref:GCN5-related N-acetyltransferase n=2 Tax=Coriobacterium TaxID=33870 RepID=F2N877_CORGP|nr:GCN5-related N-acetyltransferase [Coriobacterium glomerans PW2]